MGTKHNHIEWILQAGRFVAAKQSDRHASNELANLGWATEYAEPGYDCEHGIAFADWNDQGDFKTMKRVADLLERAGVDCEWSDEWYTCECGKAVRTAPDCAFWQPYYWAGDGFIICGDCINDDPDEYIDHLINNPRAANVIAGLNLTDYGFEKLDRDYYAGIRTMCNDDPTEIFADLPEKDCWDYAFEIAESNTFEIRFIVYRRPRTTPAGG